MNNLNGYDIEDLSVGMSATFSKTITEADIVLFAGVSGDTNAIHINEEYAATTAFKGRIAHGFLSASVSSAAVANRLPGPGAIYMDQHLKFLAPVRPGDTVHATVKVREVVAERGRDTSTPSSPTVSPAMICPIMRDCPSRSAWKAARLPCTNR